MWSDRYYYLNIYKDDSLSGDVSTTQLRAFIATIPQLEQRGAFEFSNTASFPFTSLWLLKAKSLRSYSSNDTDPKRTNLITIVCSKGENVDFRALESVFTQIAAYLNWTLVDEETDDGVEHYIIWEPEKNKRS
jgi:hypothetical protein